MAFLGPIRVSYSGPPEDEARLVSMARGRLGYLEAMRLGYPESPMSNHISLPGGGSISVQMAGGYATARINVPRPVSRKDAETMEERKPVMRKVRRFVDRLYFVAQGYPLTQPVVFSFIPSAVDYAYRRFTATASKVPSDSKYRALAARSVDRTSYGGEGSQPGLTIDPNIFLPFVTSAGGDSEQLYRSQGSAWFADPDGKSGMLVEVRYGEPEYVLDHQGNSTENTSGTKTLTPYLVTRRGTYSAEAWQFGGDSLIDEHEPFRLGTEGFPAIYRNVYIARVDDNTLAIFESVEEGFRGWSPAGSGHIYSYHQLRFVSISNWTLRGIVNVSFSRDQYGDDGPYGTGPMAFSGGMMLWEFNGRILAGLVPVFANEGWATTYDTRESLGGMSEPGSAAQMHWTSVCVCDPYIVSCSVMPVVYDPAGTGYARAEVMVHRVLQTADGPHIEFLPYMPPGAEAWETSRFLLPYSDPGATYSGLFRMTVAPAILPVLVDETEVPI